MGVAIEKHAFGKRGVPLFRQAFEQGPGRHIVIRHRGDEMGDALRRWAIEQRVDHPAAKPLPSCGRRNGDLPYKEAFRLGRRAVSRNPTRHGAIAFGDHAAVGEMRALQQVAVGRIGVERWTLRDQRRDGRAVQCNGLAEQEFG